MTVVQTIQLAQSSALVDQDGNTISLNLLPPLSADEIDQFAASLPCALPDEIRELLALTRGFEDVGAALVDFTGQAFLFGHEVLFPNGVAIASDGFGNFWVVDVNESSTSFGPIYFACHDPPIILFQCSALNEFLSELFRGCRPPHETLIDDVQEDRTFRVWRTNPGVMSHAEWSESSDPTIQEFVKSLDAKWSVIDLRDAPPGMGFSWGRYGVNTELRRHATLPIFAYRRPNGLFQKLFG
ncbi:MAG: SMI1/KNR4 family protein [Planctomycetota bacterium]|nr:MAG: SMI1/KNR4 family protein [Planctomycetota bacterium]REJ95264.1 MAG: SMI1/KNR4 family protein [Planctomycetota bacterium]REK26254.1 MAG: SMI1/KNR4 family protein [Planctomycetota bacterium]REK34386.1 MAG: SMI1/KNR4 family protein [Planctomycetota bacterium]